VPPDRTIFWSQGAIPRRGDRIDIDRLFTRDLVLLDSVDPLLRRFLIDLPVHTYPDVKILVPMTYVVDFPGDDELDSVIRCDALVGSVHELCELAGTDSLEESIAYMQSRMRVSNLRSVAVTLGADGALAFDAERVYQSPAVEVEVVDTTGAGDAFTGAFCVGLACRLELQDALELANCVAALSVQSLGAQSGLPSFEEVSAVLSSRSRPRPV
jgi:bifunctional ADP-heptose synthase (sugar kinase/adenylyltransferase)